MNDPVDVKTVSDENTNSKEWKRKKIEELKASLSETLSSPAAKERQRWREAQRKALREMGLSPEAIEDEILI